MDQVSGRVGAWVSVDVVAELNHAHMYIPSQQMCVCVCVCVLLGVCVWLNVVLCVGSR